MTGPVARDPSRTAQAACRIAGDTAGTAQ